MSSLAAEYDPFGSFLSHTVSLYQACQLLGVSRRTVYYWIKAGRLRTVRTALGSQRVLVESLRACWQDRF